MALLPGGGVEAPAASTSAGGSADPYDLSDLVNLRADEQPLRSDLGEPFGGPLFPRADRLAQIEAVERAPGLFPPEVHALYQAGRRVAAHRALVAASKSPADRLRRKPWIDDLRLWLQPATPPTTRTFNAIGATLYGEVDPQGTTHIATCYLVILFIPVVSLGSYVVEPVGWGEWQFHGAVPTPTSAKWVSRIGGAIWLGLVAWTVIDTG